MTAFIAPAANFITPALGISAVVVSPTTIQKTYSALGLAHIGGNGETLTESALSRSTNKKCRISNIFEKQEFCY